MIQKRNLSYTQPCQGGGVGAHRAASRAASQGGKSRQVKLLRPKFHRAENALRSQAAGGVGTWKDS